MGRLHYHVVSLPWGVLPVMNYTGSKKAEANTTWHDFKLVYYISAEQPSSGTMRIYIGMGVYVITQYWKYVKLT